MNIYILLLLSFGLVGLREAISCAIVHYPITILLTIWEETE